MPHHCSIGTKKDSKGYKMTWRGYKLAHRLYRWGHSRECIINSALLHDSQAAIPLAQMTSGIGLVSLYDLMDAAGRCPADQGVQRETLMCRSLIPIPGVERRYPLILPGSPGLRRRAAWSGDFDI